MIACVQCQAFFGPKRMGVSVIETAGDPPKPFRIWRADLLQCPICGKELLSNFSHEPVAENHEECFGAAMEEALKQDRYIVYGAETLVKMVAFETKEVRRYGKN